MIAHSGGETSRPVATRLATPTAARVAMAQIADSFIKMNRFVLVEKQMDQITLRNTITARHEVLRVTQGR